MSGHQYTYLSRLLSLALFSFLTVLPGCGGGSNDPDPVANNVPINISESNMVLTEGETAEFIYNIPVPDANYDEVILDLDAMLGSVSVDTTTQGKSLGNTVSAKAVANTAQGRVMVGTANEADTVCMTGIAHGPFDVSLNASAQPTAINPPTVKVSKQALSIIYGDVTPIACVSVDSPVTVTASVNANSAEISRKKCNEQPVNIAGYWSGTYSCTNTCDEEGESGDITLKITQRGFSATYTDFEANYKGTVCGNVFTFDGGGPGYTESGVFTLTNTEAATKTSSWIDTHGLCGGDCQDSLTFITQ